MKESQLEHDMAALIKLYKLPEPEREYAFEEHRGPKGRRASYRFDFAWPDKKLAVECEGGIWHQGRHTRGAGFEADCRKYNTAVINGWAVLRFTAGMVRSFEAIRDIREALNGNRSYA